jgi:drug/metabolite transporter (DMT)-like permease
VVVFISSSLQQAGMIYTTAGKAGFITALYIVIVPILGLFLKKKVRPVLWFSVILATAGLYLLSVKEGFSIGWGDLLILLSAVGLSIHIILIDHFSPKTDPVKLSSLQFLVCGIMSLPFMLGFETVSWARDYGKQNSNPVRRRHVLRGGVYLAGDCAEAYGANHDLSDPEYGIRHCGDCGDPDFG